MTIRPGWYSCKSYLQRLHHTIHIKYISSRKSFCYRKWATKLSASRLSSVWDLHINCVKWMDEFWAFAVRKEFVNALYNADLVAGR